MSRADRRRAAKEAARIHWFGPAAQSGNYVAKAEALVANLSTTGIHIIDIYHGPRCLIWRTGYCSCDPELTVREDGAA